MRGRRFSFSASHVLASSNQALSRPFPHPPQLSLPPLHTLNLGHLPVLPTLQGFEWVNDAEAHRAKWGYKADQPGAELTMALDVAGVLHPGMVRGRGWQQPGDRIDKPCSLVPKRLMVALCEAMVTWSRGAV